MIYQVSSIAKKLRRAEKFLDKPTANRAEWWAKKWQWCSSESKEVLNHHLAVVLTAVSEHRTCQEGMQISGTDYKYQSLHKGSAMTELNSLFLVRRLHHNFGIDSSTLSKFKDASTWDFFGSCMNIAMNFAGSAMAGSNNQQANPNRELSVTSDEDLRSTGTSQCDEGHSRLWDSETSDHESPVRSLKSSLTSSPECLSFSCFHCWGSSSAK